MKKIKQLDMWGEDTITGRSCELCHGIERTFFPLIVFNLDRNPTNDLPENKATVCPMCYNHLLLAMPEGIKKSRTLFAFLINRGLYTRQQLAGYTPPSLPL